MAGSILAASDAAYPLLASMGLDRESTVVRLLMRASTSHVQAVEILSKVQRRLDRHRLRR